jgi:hypothetical protein
MEGLSMKQVALYVYWLRAPMLANTIVYVGCAKNVEARRKAAQGRYNMVLTATKSKPYYDYDAAGARETIEINKHWPTLFNKIKKSAINSKYQEMTAKVSKVRKGIGNGMYGKHHTEEVVAGMKERWRDENYRKMMSAARIEMWNDEAFRKRMSVVHTSEAHRTLMSELATKQFESSEARARLSANTTKQFESREARQAARERATRQWADEDLRKQASDKSKALWKSDEFRNKRKENKALLQSGYGHPWRIKDLDKATQED